MRGSVFPTCQFSLESDMFLLSYDDLGIIMPACTVSFHLIGKIMCQVGSIYFWLDMSTCISCVGGWCEHALWEIQIGHSFHWHVNTISSIVKYYIIPSLFDSSCFLHVLEAPKSLF